MQKTPILFVVMLSIIGAADVDADDIAAQHEPQTPTDEMRADLNDLTSRDADVRRKSLVEMVREIKSGLGPEEGRYGAYGDALLPVLHRAILDLDDPYAKTAVEAIFWLGTFAKMGQQTNLPETNDIRKEELITLLEKVSHYPVPGNYAPLKEALINVLRNSKDNEARYWAALSLADGFEPVSEVEQVLASQLPVEEPNWKVQSAVLGSLSEIADDNTIRRHTELAIIDALVSPNRKTRETALRILTRHQYEGALDMLINSMATVSDSYEYTQKLASLPHFGPLSDAKISDIQAKLEQAVAGVEDGSAKEEFRKGVQSVIGILRYANIDKEHRFGLIQVGLNSIFLHTAHRGLIPGTSIAAIGSDIRFVVIKRSELEQESWTRLQTNSHPAVTYDVIPATSSTLDPAEIDNRIAYFSPDNPAAGLSNTSCTTAEGIHHSVWSTEGSERVRVWSAYQYLGYAVEPSCPHDELAE